MKKKKIILTAAAAFCIAIILSCSSEPELVMPTTGFGILSTGKDSTGYDYFIPGARTEGHLAPQPFTGQVIIPAGATGTKTGFDVTTNSKSKAVVDGGVAPAFWNLQAISGWSFTASGGLFFGVPHPVTCDGMKTAAPLDRAQYNTFTCQEGRGLGGGLSGSTSINVSGPAVEFEMAADRVTADYGMPTFQFYDTYGTYVAQTTATSIDTENGFWAKGWTYCLAGLPAGTYSIDLINATSDGAGERVNTSMVYLYGASSGNYIDDNQYFVAQQYRDFLNREPEPAGLSFWLNQIAQCSNVTYREPNESYAQCVVRKRVEVSRGIWYSDEFLQYHAGLRNPAGTSPDFNNSEFVRLCYVLYLRRDPTQAEQDFWTAPLNETNDYNNVIRGFINSDEYRLRFEPPPLPTCDPSWEEINSCQQSNGWWDYVSCQCNYGGVY
jgi:hypothetical protein